jgi:hypothetical protein
MFAPIGRGMTNFPWQSHFKNSLVGAKESYAKVLSQGPHGDGLKEPASADAGFLAYCLNEKLISTTDYLHWAKDVLEIPILIDDFFMAHAPSTRLFESRRELFAWGPHCLPVAEWDGVLIVACLQIPENFPAASSTVFLLASPERLAETWATYEAVAPASTLDASEALALTNPGFKIEASAPALGSLKIPTPVDAAEALFGAETKPIKSLFDANGDLILAEDEALETDAEVGSNPEIQLGTEDEAAGLPDGFFAETVVDTPLLSDLLPVVDSETKTHSILAPVETGAASVHDDTVALEEAPDTTAFNEASVTIALNEIPATVVAAVKAEPEAKKPLTKGPRSVEVLGSAMSLAEMKAMKPVEDETPAPGTPAVAAMPQTPIAPSMPKAPMKAANPSSNSAAYWLEKARKANTETFDKETMEAFQKLKTFFKKSMLLAIGDKDQVAKPLVWNSGFLMNSETPITEFPLNIPSFLRIVSTTQKPYHGFVTPNDANDSFFETWNQGEIPDHITVVPFMEGDLIVGMLLGIGEKSAYNRSVLQHTEAVAKELAAKILKPVSEHTKTGSARSVA